MNDANEQEVEEKNDLGCLTKIEKNGNEVKDWSK